MADYILGFRELALNETSTQKWKEISVNTGATQGTLQDIKRTEGCGWYSYRDSNKGGSVCRNRFIYWRISHDTLELVEQSFDIDLRNNQVRLHFQDSPVLDGVSVHETATKVVILVPTVSSVHRIVLPHPYKLHPQEYVSLHSAVNVAHSVFSDISSHQLRDQHNFHVINHLSVSGSIPQLAASWLTPSNGAFFGLAGKSGGILLIQMPPQECQGAVIVQEFRQASVIQRMWTGIVPAAIRGVQDAVDAPVDLCFHTLGQDLYIFALGRDCKLRIWSVKDQECVCITDLLEFVAIGSQFGKLHQSGHQHLLRKKAGSSGGMLTLGVYLNFVDAKQFMFLQTVFVSGHYQLMHLNNVSALQYELVDFCLTCSHVWALWSHHESDSVLQYTAIDGESFPGGKWTSVTLKSYSKEKFYLPDGFVDPREFYLQHIFHPGRFSVNTIIRAVNVKRRQSESSFLSEIAVPISVLKNEVVAVVENEIKNHASEYEVDDEEYYDLQVSCWSTFYRCCLQYQQVGNTVVGLGVDPYTGLISLIKKIGFSILRPRDVIECLLLSPCDEISAQELALVPIFNDVHLCGDLIVLFNCLNMIHELLTPVLIHAVAHDLFHQQSPENIIHTTFMEYFLGCDGAALIHKLEPRIMELRRLVPTLKMLLKILDLAKGAPHELAVDIADVCPSRQLLCSGLFSSPLGVLLISGSVRQLTRLRFTLCRDLLVLLLLLDGKHQIVTSSEDQAFISEVLIPQCNVLIQAYFAVMWLCDTAVTTDLSSMADFGLGKLAGLAISDGEPCARNSLSESGPCTILDMFVHGEGGTQALLLLAQSELFLERSNHIWAEVLQTIVTITAQIIWPISVNFLVPEFMLTKCLYSELQEYVRLLQSWCELNSSSCKFLSGQCYLALGEPDKAVDRFKEASVGVTHEEFLLLKVLQTDEFDPECLAVLYFLKVIRQFEQLQLPSHVIALATTAIQISGKDNPNLPTLWSILFSCHLQLGHNDEACTAMISNPNAGRRRDCLRQLVVVLFERRQLESLIRFSYSDLLEEVLTCIEQRARSVDISVHNYYDLLYAFHIFRSNYRKAASAMYECALRIAAEFPALPGLKQRAKCLLASMNCFRLVDPKYAWIIKPLPKNDSKIVSEDDIPFSGASPKRLHDGEEFYNKGLVRLVEILELRDIEKEYELVLARLRLVKKSPHLATEYLGPQYSASETVTLLLNAGLYDVAAHICTCFQLPMHSLFESLTSRCVKLSQVVSAGNLDPDFVVEACDALAQCDNSNLGTTGNIADKAWRLLEHYLNTYEEERQSAYRRCVATRLLQMNASLPTWLVKSYKKRNAPELMHVYLEHGHLGEASALVVEYVDAVLGSGRDNFHLQNCLHGTTPAVWMPYTVIDRLLFALKDQRGDSRHDEAYEEVASKLKAYQDVLATASQDVVSLASGIGQRIRIMS